MLTLFYTLSLFFIWSNLYYIINYKRLDKPFSEREISKKSDIIYYTSKFLIWFWLVFGIFTPVNNIIYGFLIFNLLKLFIFHLNKKIHSYLFKLTPPILIVLLIIIFCKLFTH